MAKGPVESSQEGSPTGPSLPPWGCDGVTSSQSYRLKWEHPQSQRASRLPLFSLQKSGKLTGIQKSQSIVDPLKMYKPKCSEWARRTRDLPGHSRWRRWRASVRRRKTRPRPLSAAAPVSVGRDARGRGLGHVTDSAGPHIANSDSHQTLFFSFVSRH